MEEDQCSHDTRYRGRLYQNNVYKVSTRKIQGKPNEHDQKGGILFLIFYFSVINLMQIDSKYDTKSSHILCFVSNFTSNIWLHSRLLRWRRLAQKALFFISIIELELNTHFQLSRFFNINIWLLHSSDSL